MKPELEALQQYGIVDGPLYMPSVGKARRATSHHPDMASNNDAWNLPFGETITIMDEDGPGIIQHMWFTIACNEYCWPRLLRIKVFYDGADKPSVDCPIGDFFASGMGLEREVNSMMVRNVSEGRARNCYWQMPFKKHCKIEIINESRDHRAGVYFHIDWRKVPSLPEETLYFHAWYKQENPAIMDKFYEILATKGRGKYVGTVLNILTNEHAWFGEGDEYFYVDGEEESSVMGTGTEDYVNDGWGLHDGHGAWFGVTNNGGFRTGDRVCVYRWHVPDPIPFDESLKLEIEHQGWVLKKDYSVAGTFEWRPDDYSSVAFWYQTPFRTDLPDLPSGYERLPYGNSTIVEVEDWIDEAVALKGEKTILEWSMARQKAIVFKGEKVGASIAMPFEVAESGTYEILAMAFNGPDYGIYSADVDGKYIGEVLEPYSIIVPEAAAKETGQRFDFHAPHQTMAKMRVLGRFELKAGKHVVTWHCEGRNSLSTGYTVAVDNLVLSKIDVDRVVIDRG
jgi:hypothetical protein